ncbi:MAG: DUF2807 domain-containing protein [Bacteroidales bacterium]|nr:DUF2807 domain-containing protein [Bacteroidales bacterium]
MKKLFLTTAMFALFANFSIAQTLVPTADFDRVSVRQSFNIILVPSDRCEVVFPENLQLPEDLEIKDVISVDEGILTIAIPASIRSWTHRGELPPIRIYYKSLTSLTLSGSSSAISEQTVRINAGTFQVNLSGSSRAVLDVTADRMTSRLSGSSNLTLTGRISEHNFSASGSSTINAEALEVNESRISLSGASNARINTQSATGSVSGASILNLNPEAQHSVSRSGTANIRGGSGVATQNRTTPTNQPAEITLSATILEQISSAMAMVRDVTVGSIGAATNATDSILNIIYGDENIVITMNPDGQNVTITRTTPRNATRVVTTTTTTGARRTAITATTNRTGRFNPRYAGVDFGFGGFGQDFFRNTLPNDYEDMQLRLSQSFVINLNLIDYGIRLGRSNFGIGTGLGIGWNIYRFLEHDVIPSKDRDTRMFVIDRFDPNVEDRSYRKSNLRSSWLRVPLFIQYQNSRRFTVSAGVVGNIRLGASAKQVWTNPGNSRRQRFVNRDDFYLNGFRLDTELRVTHRNLGFFAAYSLTDMFLNNRGPEDLRAFSFGISFKY